MTSVESNSRGIPRAPFIEDVGAYLKEENAEVALQKFQETISKYRFMEKHLEEKRKALSQKLPEMINNIRVIDQLKHTTKPTSTLYELSDTVYANALIEPSSKVFLWLGANVMCEYDLEEASKLLSDKLNVIETNLETCQSDLDYLKEQVTTMEVNMARVYNYEVKNKK